MGKISNLNSYGFSEQPRFDGFINSLKEKADTTEIAEQVKKQESDIKNINDINTKQDEQILGLNVDIKQSGNAFTFTQGGKNLAVINQENGEGSSVIGGTFSNGKLTLNNSNNTSVEIDVSDGALVDLSNYYTKKDSDGRYALKTSIPSLDGYATEQWVTNKGYLTEHQDLSTYATKDELSTKADKEHTHLLKDITDYKEPDLSKYATKDEIPNLEGYATEQWVTDKNYLTTHQDLTDYAKKTDIPNLEGYATEQWVNNKNYLTQHQSLADYYTKSEVDTKIKSVSGGTNVDLTKYYTKTETDDKYALKTSIPSLKGYATEQWVENKNYLTTHQDLTDYAKKTDIPNMEGYATKVDVDAKQDKGDYALKSDIKPIPSVLSAFNNDVGYLTTHQDLTPYAKKTDIPSLESYATEEWVNSKNYLTQHQSLEGYAETDYVITELGKKADAKHVHAISDVTDLQNKLKGYALKTDIQPLPKFKTVNGQAITGSTDDITITTDLSNYYKKTDTSGATEIRDALAKKQDYNENYVTTNQLADYATKSDVERDLSQKADNSAIPSNTIELTFTLTDGTQTTKTFYIQ